MDNYDARLKRNEILKKLMIWSGIIMFVGACNREASKNDSVNIEMLTPKFNDTVKSYTLPNIKP